MYNIETAIATLLALIGCVSYLVAFWQIYKKPCYGQAKKENTLMPTKRNKDGTFRKTSGVPRRNKDGKFSKRPGPKPKPNTKPKANTKRKAKRGK